jgi:5-methylcytosine-specific restriction protein B
MNIADRSLTIVDFALRRRFAFVNLQPRIGDEWLKWVHEKNGIDKQLLQKIQSNMQKLNAEIAEDKTLGSAFEIGHSFVTPPSEETVDDAGRWFREIVETEIGPLLDEYWFDNADKAKKSIEQLLEGF